MIERSIISLIVFLALSFVLGKIWLSIFSAKKYRIFVAPGIIVHEFSHAIAALICGARIQKIDLFSPQGGSIVSTKPKIPVFGDFLVSFSPILGGIGMILFLSWIFRFQPYFPIIDLSQPFWTGLWLSLNNIVLFFQSRWLAWEFWVFAYLVISIAICLVPSARDLKNAFFAVLAFFVLAWFFPGILNLFFNQYLARTIAAGISFEILTLAISLSALLLKKILAAIF